MISYVVPLHEPVWQTATPDGSAGIAIDKATFQNVLANLKGFYIHADWNMGADQVDLDNVSIVPINDAGVPEPGSFVLAAPALAACFLIRRSR